MPEIEVARNIALTSVDELNDADWQLAAYEQFMRDDPPEDSVYDGY